MQDLDRHPHANGDLPKNLERFPDLDDVPQDLIEWLALHRIVMAECQHCSHSGYYIDDDRFNEVECKNPDCSEKIVFTS